MPRNPSAPRLSLVQRIALAGLLLCVALAQSLNFAHRALHHDVRMLAYAHEEAHAHAHADTDSHGADCVHGHGIFARLFSGHDEGDESCRLFDASSTFLELNQPLALINSAPSAHLLIATALQWPSAVQALLFEARGPPHVRL